MISRKERKKVNKGQYYKVEGIEAYENKKNKIRKYKNKEVSLNMQNIEKVENNVKDVKPKKQAPSKSYTLKSLAENIVKLKTMELITKEDAEIMEKIKNKAVQKYMADQFKM